MKPKPNKQKYRHDCLRGSRRAAAKKMRTKGNKVQRRKAKNEARDY